MESKRGKDIFIEKDTDKLYKLWVMRGCSLSATMDAVIAGLDMARALLYHTSKVRLTMNSQLFQFPVVKKAFILLLLCTFFVFNMELPSEASVIANNDEGPFYYAFSNSDLRLCPSPVCGGMFVREVNRRLTRCSDGTLMPECYVAGLDFSLLGMQDSDVWRVQRAFVYKEALIKGAFAPFSPDFPTVSTLVASEVWEEKGIVQPRKISAFFQDNGIRCITNPCQWLDALILNTPFYGTIAGIDLNSSGAAAADIEEGYRSLSSTGIIANGRLRRTSGPAGKGLEFETARFYLKTQNGLLCGGPEKVSCPNDMFCDIAAPDACNAQDLNGTCTSIPEVCTMIYAPVCGCDGKTYSNDCQRLGAQVLLDHTGECLTTGRN